MSNMEWRREGGAYVPPNQPGREVRVSDQELQRVLTSIAATNLQIRNALIGTSAAVAGYRRETGMRDQYMAGRVAPIDDTDESIAASQQEREQYRAEQIQRNVVNRGAAGRRAGEVLSTFQRVGYEKQVQMLAQYRGLTPGDQGRVDLSFGDQTFSDVEEALRRRSEGGATAADENIINQLNADLLRHLTNQFAQKAPTSAERILDAIETSGLRQLRYGQLPLQDILRSAGILAGQGVERSAARQQQIVDAQRRIDAARATGQEPTPFDVTLAAERAGLASRLGTRVGAAGARFLPVAGQAIGAAEVIGGVVQSQIIGRYQDLNRVGQITGEGARAGIRARYDAFTLGLNPFDMISQETATQIVAGLRGEGFRGQQRQSLQDAVADAINDLGTNVDETIQLYTDAIRKNGMTIAEATRLFEDFDDQARGAGMAVAEYTRTFSSLNQQFLSLGAGSASTDIAQAVARFLPRGIEPGVYGQMLEQQRGYLAAQTGSQLSQVFSRDNAEQAVRAMDQFIMRERERVQLQVGNDPNAIANQLAQTSPIFRGMNPNDVQRIVERVQGGRGVGAQADVRAIERQYGLGFERIRGRRELDGRRLYRELIEAGRGRNDFARREYGLTPDQVTEILDSGGRDDVMAYESRGDIPMDKLRNLRRQTYERLQKGGLLSRDDLRTFRDRMGERDFDVVRFLRESSARRGRTVGDSLEVGGITIRLQQGTESKLFELAKDKAVAAAKGLRRLND